jgi:hypothetical protein
MDDAQLASGKVTQDILTARLNGMAPLDEGAAGLLHWVLGCLSDEFSDMFVKLEINRGCEVVWTFDGKEEGPSAFYLLWQPRLCVVFAFTTFAPRVFAIHCVHWWVGMFSAVQPASLWR